MSEKPTARIQCTDCATPLGFGGKGPAYAYPDGWRCQTDRDRHERIITRAKRMMDEPVVE